MAGGFPEPSSAVSLWELSLQARTDRITAMAMTPITTVVVPTIMAGPTTGITAGTTDIGEKSDRGCRKWSQAAMFSFRSLISKFGLLLVFGCLVATGAAHA